MKLFLPILLSLFQGCATDPKTPRVYEDVIEITEITPNRLTALTKQNLFHLAKVYDLKPFLYTKQIHIQSYVVPHSHPILTINTRHAERPHHLLATWLHEEFHWWVGLNSVNYERTLAELKKMFPDIPGGNISPRSTYLHLIICYLEYRALVHYLGEKESRLIIKELIEKDKLYPWVYAQILNKRAAIAKVIVANKLLPPPLSP
jgi:hypothetical protein